MFADEVLNQTVDRSASFQGKEARAKNRTTSRSATDVGARVCAPSLSTHPQPPIVLRAVRTVVTLVIPPSDCPQAWGQRHIPAPSGSQCGAVEPRSAVDRWLWVRETRPTRRSRSRITRTPGLTDPIVLQPSCRSIRQAALQCQSRQLTHV